MTTPMRNRMRRHTRPADFVSKSRQAEAVAFCRPGGRSFSFTGEFPDMQDQQPVEANTRRRNYVSGSSTGAYHAVRHDDTARTPVVSKYGMRFMPAVTVLSALAIFLFCIFGAQMDERERISNSILGKRDRITVLEVQCGKTKDDIDAQSSDVNIYQEAVRMGLINSKGVSVHYLEAPKDAVITLTGTSDITALASIWGN